MCFAPFSYQSICSNLDIRSSILNKILDFLSQQIDIYSNCKYLSFIRRKESLFQNVSLSRLINYLFN
ncbi:hypothetical protein HanRHA438_Chr15g0702581 [Helianthus annuus]|nr:hypothetical protein HanRHA438_Chr15g0702581 [Helianthus annuus]